MDSSFFMAVAIGVATTGVLIALLLRSSSSRMTRRSVAVAGAAIGMVVTLYLNEHRALLDEAARSITIRAVLVVVAVLAAAAGLRRLRN